MEGPVPVKGEDHPLVPGIQLEVAELGGILGEVGKGAFLQGDDIPLHPAEGLDGLGDAGFMDGLSPDAVKLPLPGGLLHIEGKGLVLLHRGVDVVSSGPGERRQRFQVVPVQKERPLGGDSGGIALLGEEGELPPAVVAFGLCQHGVIEPEPDPSVLEAVQAHPGIGRVPCGDLFGALPVGLLPPGKRLLDDGFRRFGKGLDLLSSGATRQS